MSAWNSKTGTKDSPPENTRKRGIGHLPAADHARIRKERAERRAFAEKMRDVPDYGIKPPEPEK